MFPLFFEACLGRGDTGVHREVGDAQILTEPSGSLSCLVIGAGVAQLVELHVANVVVAGSNPVSCSISYLAHLPLSDSPVTANAVVPG